MLRKEENENDFKQNIIIHNLHFVSAMRNKPKIKRFIGII